MTANRAGKRKTQRLADTQGAGHRAAAHHRGIGTTTADVDDATPSTPSAPDIDTILATLAAVPAQHDATGQITTLVTRHGLLAERQRRAATTPRPRIEVYIPTDQGLLLAETLCALMRQLYTASAVTTRFHRLDNHDDAHATYHCDLDDAIDLTIAFGAARHKPAQALGIPIADTIAPESVGHYLQWLLAQRGSLLDTDTAAQVAHTHAELTGAATPLRSDDLHRCARQAEAHRDARLAHRYALGAASTIGDDELARITAVDLAAAAASTVLPLVIAPEEITTDEHTHDTLATGSLTLPIGELTTELGEHQRYTLNLTATTRHALVLADSDLAASATVTSIIATAALQYRPEHLQIYLIDNHATGASRTALAELPHVRQRSNIISEVATHSTLFKISDILMRRRSAYEQLDVSDFASYLQVRDTTDDPHGQILLVIDNLQTLVSDRQTERTRKTRISKLHEILSYTEDLGVHVVLARNNTVPGTTSIDAVIGSPYTTASTVIHHHLDNPHIGSSTVVYDTSEALRAVSNIPDRTDTFYDLHSHLHGRIVDPDATTRAAVAATGHQQTTVTDA